MAGGEHGRRHEQAGADEQRGDEAAQATDGHGTHAEPNGDGDATVLVGRHLRREQVQAGQGEAGPVGDPARQRPVHLAQADASGQ